jgi:hypothetical protein
VTSGQRGVGPHPRLRLRRLAMVVAAVGALGALAGAWAAWVDLQFRAAAQRSATVFSGSVMLSWEGPELRVSPGARQVPLGLAAPGALDGVGSTLRLPFRADAGQRVRLRFLQLENHASDPPVLAVSLAGEPTVELATRPGGGLPVDAIEIGTTAVYEVDVPGRTRCGDNELRVEAVRGAWLGIAALEIGLAPPAGTATGVAGRAGWLAVSLPLALLLFVAASAPREEIARAGWRRRLAGRALLVVAASAIGAAAAEAAVRAFARTSPRVASLLYSPHDPLATDRGGDFRDWLRRHRCAPAPCSVWSDGFRLNSLGLHTHDYATAKPPGTRRLVGIGDSFMFYGGPSPYADEWFVRLGQHLQRAGRSEKWEAINLGMSCVGVVTETLMLRHEALALDPDVVVWSLYPGNDVTDEREGSPLLPAALAAGADAATPAPATEATRAPERGLQHSRSQLVRLGARLARLAAAEPAALVSPCDGAGDGDRGRDASPPQSAEEPRCGVLEEPAPPYDPAAKTMSDESFDRYLQSRLHNLYRADHPPAADVARLLARMAAARPLLTGRRAVLVVIPDELVVSPGMRARALAAAPELAGVALEFRGAHDGVVSGLRAQGWQVVDLLPAFQAAAAGRETALYHPNDGHLGVAGNRLAADTVAAALLASPDGLTH